MKFDVLDFIVAVLRKIFFQKKGTIILILQLYWFCILEGKC